MAGSFANITGSPSCRPCPVNSYSANDGDSVCTKCVPGFGTEGKTGQTECRKIPLHVNTTEWTQLFVERANQMADAPTTCELCNDRFNPRVGTCVEMAGGHGMLFSVHEVNHKEPTRVLAILKREDNGAFEYAVFDQLKYCPTVVDRQISFALTFDGVGEKAFNTNDFKQAASVFFQGMKPDDVEVYSCANASAARHPRPREEFEDLTTVDNPKPENTAVATGPTGMDAAETGGASGATGAGKVSTGATGLTPAGPKVCAADVKRCPNSGLYVKRDPANNCKFSACVDLTGYETGASGMTGVEEVVEPVSDSTLAASTGGANGKGIGFLATTKIGGYTLEALLGPNREQNLNIIKAIVGTVAGVVDKNGTALPRVDFVQEHDGEVHVGVWISARSTAAGAKMKNHFQGIMNRSSHLVNLFRSAGFGKATKVALSASKYVGIPVEESVQAASTGPTGLLGDDLATVGGLARGIHDRIDKANSRTGGTGSTGSTGGSATSASGAGETLTDGGADSTGAGDLLEDIKVAQEHLDDAKKKLEGATGETGATGEAEDESVFQPENDEEKKPLVPPKHVKYTGTGGTGTAASRGSETGLQENEVEDNIDLITECSKQPVSYWCDSPEGRKKCGLTDADCEVGGEAEAENLGKPEIAEEATGITGPAETGATESIPRATGETGTVGATGEAVSQKASTGAETTKESESGPTGSTQKSTGSTGSTGSSTAKKGTEGGDSTGTATASTGATGGAFNDDDDLNKFSHDEPKEPVDAVTKAANKFWGIAKKKFDNNKDGYVSECELERLVLHSDLYKRGTPAKVVDAMTHILHQQVMKLDLNKDGKLSGDEIVHYAHHHSMPHYLKVATQTLKSVFPSVDAHEHLNQEEFVYLLTSRKGFPQQLAMEIFNEFKGEDESVDKHEIAKFLTVENTISKAKYMQVDNTTAYDPCKHSSSGSSGAEGSSGPEQNEETGHAGSGTGSGSETGSGSGPESESISEAASETGSSSGSEIDTATGTASGTGSASGSGSDTATEKTSETGSASGSGSGTATGAASGTGSGSGSGSETASGTASETGSGSGSGSETATGSASGSGSGHGSGSGRGSGAGSGSGHSSGLGSGSGHGSGSGSGSGHGSGSAHGSGSGSGSGHGSGSEKGELLLPVPVPHIGNKEESEGEEIVIPSPVPDVNADVSPEVAGVVPDLQSLIEKSSQSIVREYCARVTLHGLTAASTTSYKNMVRKLKVDYVADKKLSDLLDLYGVKSDDIIVSECKFCKEKNESKLPVTLTAWGSFATGPEARVVRATPAPKPNVTTTKRPVVKTIVATTTPAPQAPIAPREIAPIHVDDCVRTNTAEHSIVAHDRSVGKVVEVFRTDLLESKEWWIRVSFKKEKTPLPFALKEVVKVPCEHHGLEAETFQTGSTGASMESTGSTGSGESGSTGITGTAESGASGLESMTGATASAESTGGAETGSAWNEQATFTTGATASEGNDGLEIVPEATLKETSVATPRVITAQEAVDKSKKQLVLERSKRDALETAISFLRAARHRDAAFVRAVQTETHIIGYDNIAHQVEALGKSAKTARVAYKETLKISKPGADVRAELKKLDAETKSQVVKLTGIVRFSNEECANAKRIFHVCPDSFACKDVADQCRSCSDCATTE
jgi:Ca2+-binding EF-hand superfamily protein